MAGTGWISSLPRPTTVRLSHDVHPRPPVAVNTHRRVSTFLGIGRVRTGLVLFSAVHASVEFSQSMSQSYKRHWQVLEVRCILEQHNRDVRGRRERRRDGHVFACVHHGKQLARQRQRHRRYGGGESRRVPVPLSASHDFSLEILGPRRATNPTPRSPQGDRASGYGCRNRS